MKQHDFTQHEPKTLYFLRASLLRTLNNNACIHLQQPVSNTIGQIEDEMRNRGMALTIKK